MVDLLISQALDSLGLLLDGFQVNCSSFFGCGSSQDAL